MKVLVLFALFALGASFSFQRDASGFSDVQKQEAILKLLYKVYEPIPEKFAQLHEASSAVCHSGKAADKLNKEIDDHRVAPQHHWFSLFDTHQREDALMLFDVLMESADFETFAKCAAYYRAHMNEGEFVYALYVAVIHSPLTQHVVLPPLYEVTPHLFTNNEVIQQAYSAKMRQQAGTFKMSFTGTQRNPEQRVAYFGEDIGLNVHHVTWHMDFPFWWQDSYGYHLDRKGELFFWAHHQLTARFDAERLSNNLDLVDELYWDRPIVEGFAPHTSYKFGGEFPSRPDHVHFEDVDGVARIRDLMCYEGRIKDAIAHGYATAKDGSKIDLRNDHGIDVLGDIIESSMYSPNAEYYGALHNLAHIVLGRQGDPHGKFGMPPGVMEHFETATRDPSFFRLHKYMDNIFKEHKDSLPPYTADDIEFAGISVDGIHIDGKLETFFEDFEFDLSNAVDSADGVEDVHIGAVVSRINHEDFKLEVEVTNNNGGKVDCVLRAALCPHRDSNGIVLSIEEKRWSCIEIEKKHFFADSGHHTYSFDLRHGSTTAPDVPSFSTLAEKTKAGESLPVTRACGIPDRMLLPKGKPEGMEFDLVVMVSDGSKDSVHAAGTFDASADTGTHAQCGIHGELYPDKRPMGYPLDRRIPDERIFHNAPNTRSSTVKVFHRE